MMKVKTFSSTKIIIISVISGVVIFLVVAGIGCMVYFAFFYQYPTYTPTAATTVKVYSGINSAI